MFAQHLHVLNFRIPLQVKLKTNFFFKRKNSLSNSFCLTLKHLLCTQLSHAHLLFLKVSNFFSRQKCSTKKGPFGTRRGEGFICSDNRDSETAHFFFSLFPPFIFIQNELCGRVQHGHFLHFPSLSSI